MTAEALLGVEGSPTGTVRYLARDYASSEHRGADVFRGVRPRLDTPSRRYTVPMRRRTERLLRQLLKEIDTCLDLLEAESELLSRKKIGGSNDLAIVEGLTSNLNAIALSIEFELHLKKTSVGLPESRGGVEIESQVQQSNFLLEKPKAILNTLGSLESRLEERFGSMSNAFESEIDKSCEQVDDRLYKPNTASCTPSALEAKLDEWFGPLLDEPKT
jgi:hypothetical protein